MRLEEKLAAAHQRYKAALVELQAATTLVVEALRTGKRVTKYQSFVHLRFGESNLRPMMDRKTEWQQFLAESADARRSTREAAVKRFHERRRTEEQSRAQRRNPPLGRVSIELDGGFSSPTPRSPAGEAGGTADAVNPSTRALRQLNDSCIEFQRVAKPSD
jgi:hypothetical protein